MAPGGLDSGCPGLRKDGQGTICNCCALRGVDQGGARQHGGLWERLPEEGGGWAGEAEA